MPLFPLEAQRAQNLMEEKRRRAEAAEKSSAVEELLQKRQRLFAAGIRSAFAAPKDAQSISENMQREVEAINLSLRAELGKIGLPEDYLQPVCRCALCRDTGYVGEPIREMCVCLRRAVMNTDKYRKLVFKQKLRNNLNCKLEHLIFRVTVSTR